MCNYSTCVQYSSGDSTGTYAMNFKCNKTWSNRTNGVYGNQWCSSSYNPVPGPGQWVGGHVCNDDSELQYDGVKYNKSYSSCGKCSDVWLAYWAPSCD